MKFVVIVAGALVTAGCTSVTVQPVASASTLQNVCIVTNPKVMVGDFVPVLRDGFSRNKVATTVVQPAAAANCEVTLTYTALRSWDFTPYLSHAELRLWRNGEQIGSADYHLNGKGGLSLTKWASTRDKMDPVIDQLLGGKATR